MPGLSIIEASVQRTAALHGSTKQRKINLRPALSYIPKYADADYNVDSASSVNTALLTNFNIDMSNPHGKIDEWGYRKEFITMNIRGNKLVPADTYRGLLDFSEHDVRPYVINNEHYLNTLAEARHGLHTVDEFTKKRTREQTVTEGAWGEGRDSGLERSLNPKVYPRLQMGVPFSTQPDVPTIHANRINDVVLAPLPYFPSTGF
jgi:hypothetical protein